KIRHRAVVAFDIWPLWVWRRVVSIAQISGGRDEITADLVFSAPLSGYCSMESATPTAPAAMPTMSSALSRRLPWGVVGAGLVAAGLCIGLIESLGRADWWPAFQA